MRRPAAQLRRTAAAVVRRSGARWTLLAGTALAAGVELLPGVPVPLLAPAGFWLLLGAPWLLWYGCADAFVSTRDGRALVAVALAIGSDLVTELLLNTVLPPLGDDRPLRQAPLALAAALAVLLLAWALPPGPAGPGPTRPRSRAAARAARRNQRRNPRRTPGLRPVLLLGAGCLLLSVGGAIRLNNGLGSTMAVLALVAMAVLFVQLLRGRRRYPEAVLGLGLFLLAAALLLLTSLRGWFITGHDIQREYEVFELAFSADRWQIAAFRDPYNACLSITLLPTAFARLTGIGGLYVFKAVFPLLFALSAPLVHRSVRNVTQRVVALLSALYFVAFPTFFTDMTFLARQEIAFLLLGAALVVLTDRSRPIRARRLAFTGLMGGVVLSHYSTTFVVVMVLAIALLTDHAWRLAARLRARRRGGPRQPVTAFVTWWIVVATAVAAVLWTGPLTGTGGQLRSTVTATVQDAVDPAQAQSGSSDTSYSLLGGQAVTPQQRLAQYQADTLQLTAKDRANGDYLPAQEVAQYQVQAVAEPDLPLTAVGRALGRTGLDVSGANKLVRQWAADLLQLLLLVGLAVCLWTRGGRVRRAFRPARDQVTLSVAMIVVIGLLTVLPQLSVDYGVLRAFQQGLFFFAPFIAAGSLWAFRWARRWALPLAGTLAVAFFLDLTGAVPQVIGGYPPQLNLNNAGQYYDIYYVQPQERSAIGWLEQLTTDDQKQNVQSEVQTDRYTFSRLQTLIRGRALDDIYPTLVGSNSYVFLGSTTVTKDEATTFYRGDLVTYRYPTALLDTTKNEIYSSDGAEIFR
ncbi:DUF2206 domain-containing protein [Kitasatospora sp. NBC_01302]|uniref:DUF2206 domain-containing protein n=1 Tax=Kitasatospora sp. NBC_01302 TaxID=2903575 RepID=UPI002E152475|nr:DUF2206 domain-containing protein [Kitasatospora sp. NBC_01302]